MRHLTVPCAPCAPLENEPLFANFRFTMNHPSELELISLLEDKIEAAASLSTETIDY